MSPPAPSTVGTANDAGLANAFDTTGTGGVGVHPENTGAATSVPTGTGISAAAGTSAIGAVGSGTAAGSSLDAGTLTLLRRSFDQLVAQTGGAPGTASLGGFLQALATNLHNAPSSLGNFVNERT